MKRLFLAVIIFTTLAVISGNFSNWQSALANTNPLLLDLTPPVLLKPQNNANSVQLRPLFDWADVPNATKYRLQVSTVADFSSTVINKNALVNSKFTPGAGVLGNSTTYYWRVFAGDDSGWGPSSNVWNFTTTSPPPSIPWTLYQTGVPYSLFGVDFSDLNSQIGVAVGQGGTVIKTSDAGEEWTVTYSNINIWMNDVKFDPNRDGVVWAAGMGGVIIKSTDYGDTWSVVRPFDTPDHTIRGIGVPPGDLDHAIFIGYAGTFFETFNGGTTFTQRFDIPFTMHSVDFSPEYLSDGRGIISGTDGKVWNTSNHGSTWVVRNTNRYDYLNDVVFLSPSVAMICGNNGTILRSTNWGKSWSLNVQYLTSEHLRSIDNYENIVTVCGDNGKIMTANDGGITFVDQLNGENRHLYGVSLREESVGVVVGEIGSAASGALYYTSMNGFVGISQIGSEIPFKYSKSQNYPNPFNPTTKINFALPKQGLVSIKVYDMLGREVRNLVNEVKSAGHYSVDFNGTNLTSGAYFYKIQVNDFSDVKRMLLIK